MSLEESMDRLSSGGGQISMERLAAFLQLLAHDVRNDLNSIDLMCAYVQEISTEAEVVQELRQIRAGAQYGSRRIASVSRAFAELALTCIAYPLKALCEDLQQRTVKQSPDLALCIHWILPVEDGDVSVDGTLIFEVFAELLKNAAAFSDPGAVLTVSAEFGKTGGKWRISQPSKELAHVDASGWGWEPFVSTQRGHYGLGLYRVRRLLEAQKAGLSFRYDKASESWVTEVTFQEGDEA